jgi:hypothetical protein
MTDRRLFFEKRDGRRVTTHWAALSDVRNAGVARAGRDHRFMAAAASLPLGIGLAFFLGAFGLAPCLLLSLIISGLWYLSEGKATVSANLGGQSVQAEIKLRDRGKASEFVNMLFELKDSSSLAPKPAA